MRLDHGHQGGLVTVRACVVLHTKWGIPRGRKRKESKEGRQGSTGKESIQCKGERRKV